MRCVGAGIGVPSFYTSLCVARMVPTDLRFVVGYSFGDGCMSLYSLKASLHMDLMWLCLVSVRYSIVGLVLEMSMRCRSNMVLCMPLVLNGTAWIAGCR